MTTKRVSTTSVTADAPIALYSNSPENNDLGPNYKKVIPGNTVGAMYLSSGDVSYNEIDGTVVVVEKHPGSFAIVTLRDASGNSFSTRQENVFIIGK